MLKKKLPKRVKARWVKALRDGKYDQGVEALCRTDREGNTYYCCKGVYEDLFDPRPWVKFDSNLFLNNGARWGVKDTPCGSVNYWTIPTDAPHSEVFDQLFYYRGSYYSVRNFLSDCNDHAGWSFKKIADWIEKNL